MYTFLILSYRDKGTGKPWARHSKLISFLTCLSIQLRFISDDSEGALTPTGSICNCVNFKENYYDKLISNLNVGIGYPWASHSRSKSAKDFILYLYVSDLAENAGDFKPTGSKRYSSEISFQTFIWISHLNSGTGYPWDWHNKTIAFLELFLKRVPSKSDDSVGDLNPTGSNKYKFK